MTMSGPAYCTADDVITAVTSFNYGGTPGDISTDIVQAAILQASATVSAWTGTNWAIDAQGNSLTPPDIIQSIAIDIATYYATLSYRKNKPLSGNATNASSSSGGSSSAGATGTDPVILRYNMAIQNLKAIQEGQITPNPAPAGAATNRPGRVINTQLRALTPYDSGTRISRSGSVEAEDTAAGWNGANPPWL